MGTAFGIGSPATYPVQTNSPYFGQTIGTYPSSFAQPYAQPLQQILQSLQIVPYQIQQLQQLLQVVPVQLQQLQQLIQLIPQQIQQLQQAQGQQFGQTSGWLGVPVSYPFSTPFQQLSGFNVPFAGQQTHVM